MVMIALFMSIVLTGDGNDSTFEVVLGVADVHVDALLL